LEPQRSRHGRVLLCLGVLAVLLVAAAVVLNRLGGSDAFSLWPDAGAWAYLAMAAMVFGDAVCPVLPGETTLNAGATLAAEGHLHLILVIAAGTVGAVVGDSTLYWIARVAKRRIEPQIERAEKDERVALALSFLDGNAPLLIVAGRYVPGLRFVVNATMGVTEFPYLRFLPWSVLGGLLWSSYTCVLAYEISTALAGYPLASVVISTTVTMAAVALVVVVMRRSRPAAAGEAGPPGPMADL
jgi:membrane protein DedA with SNARE-associated domain